MGEGQRERATSFGLIARDYDRFRPEPPVEALDWLLSSGARAVAEIGAGTGLLTRLLVRRALEVFAIEPDPRMREVLEERVSGAHVEDGRGEEIPLADASVDAVLASSSWHWVDHRQGFTEAARVLRPGGTLGLLWTGPDRRVPWVRQMMAGGMVLSEEQRRKSDAERHRRHRPQVPHGAPFGSPEVAVFHGVKRASLDDLVGLPGTYADTISSDSRTRERLLADVRRFLVSEIDVGDGDISLPIGCIAWRASRS